MNTDSCALCLACGSYKSLLLKMHINLSLTFSRIYCGVDMLIMVGLCHIGIMVMMTTTQVEVPVYCLHYIKMNTLDY